MRSATPAHCCATFLCHLGCEIYDDRHQYPMSNNKDHLVGQITKLLLPDVVEKTFSAHASSKCMQISALRWIWNLISWLLFW